MSPLFGFLFVLLVAFAGTAAHASQTETDVHSLQAIQQTIETRYADVQHLDADRLDAMLSARSDVIIFDVREAEEFDVSHLEGAIHIDPGMWRFSFMNRYRDAIWNKTVVFYCSVGVRSSRMAEAFQSALVDAGAKAVYNLKGGVFHWHNEYRSLVSSTGETTYVHPYDEYWGELLERAQLVRYGSE